MNIEEVVRKYYDSRKALNKATYQIEVLQKNNERLMQYDCGAYVNQINERVNNNIKKIVEQRLKISNIEEKFSSVDYVINNLDDEDKQILEKRYRYNKALEALGLEFNISKASAYRRLNKIVNQIEVELKA